MRSADSAYLYVVGHVGEVQAANVVGFDAARSRRLGRDPAAITMPWALVRVVSMLGRAGALLSGDSTQRAPAGEPTTPVAARARER